MLVQKTTAYIIWFSK